MLITYVMQHEKKLFCLFFNYITMIRFLLTFF